MRTCSVAGCGKSASGYSHLCDRHKKTQARHGHPLQRPITARELKPFIKAVRGWLETRSKGSIMDLLRRRWDDLVHEARLYAHRLDTGKPFQRNFMEAYQIILRVEEENRFEDMILVLLATGYLFHAEPRRFLSDEAFGFQVVRRFRALTQRSFGVRWDHQSGTARRTYRDIPPKTIRCLWSLLLQSKLPLYGAKIAQTDLAERSRWVPNDETIEAALLGNSHHTTT